MTAMPIEPFTDATAMLAALDDGAVSAVELLDHHLERIGKHNPTLNAIVTPDYDNARARARAADEARARGESAPLLGLPLTIKDCIDVAGLIGTAGLEDFAERVPPADSRVAARVREAGAVIMGKTNVPPSAADWQSSNPIFGRTNNPWDLDRTPGGSTGGGAAAVAAGLTPLEFGSDIGGSIRVPASFCGIYGHKPSETALTKSGHFPGSALPNPGVVMSVQGPLARSARDLELAFDASSGPEVGEDVAWSLNVPPARCDDLSSFRVAVMPPIEWLPVDDEISRRPAAPGRLPALRRRNRGADAAGGVRRPAGAPSAVLLVAVAVYRTAERGATPPSGGQHAGHRRRVRHRSGQRPGGQRHGPHVGWLSRREGIRQSYRDFFRDWDVLLAPITIVPAFPHTDEPWPLRTVDVNGRRPFTTAYRSCIPPWPRSAASPPRPFRRGSRAAGFP